ncbi:hypothetical protein ANOBCDAF_01069 [Pleomorphomonas sp. T1.2MG-36]|uniref:GNAT family N-acetyltransferase n=1 Tax=Pleomorphomonas sp. T1.2MG-36 TaxID=3041167 RepID=UPI002477A2DC|nr:GNAT family N-acetyltransferase [Pleomorphomonas sp. T1.2MG-36]CAI9403221.1 hypothetical protein ANOBCDAF_01069 [Pleomorphomonas sp. T1.2MG-36]
MLIRPAMVADADEAASVLRRSICDLCLSDHSGDAQTLAQWLANKTPENVRAWIEAPDCFIVVAEENGAIIGVGGASHSGEITLNYVAPEARFRGVSKAILKSLEAYLNLLGCEQITLTSTRAARTFYIAMGYEDGEAQEAAGEQAGLPMRKSLGPKERG